ncbi:interferon-induced protein 44 [Lates calcarifer]|uniref:Interferon-induced protein 44 n=1 Tax=Lates calcarifer TaxID=8187 RepID=A0AAJ7PW23_LATCA|nr:interferon-induced protein 44 [Lates calcarifer]
MAEKKHKGFFVRGKFRASKHKIKVPLTPPPLTFETPWRKISWGNKEEQLTAVKNYKPINDDIEHLQILLYGPVGAGKSSFINSVSNVLRGRLTLPASVCSVNSEISFTKQYETHQIRKGRDTPKTFYPFVFSDMMGLEEGSDSGVHPDDIKLAMKGHVKEGHTFNHLEPLTDRDPGYNPAPSLQDKVHVLVCVISANSAEITPSVLQKMKEVKVRDLGIPQMAIMTNVDLACGETEKDLKNVYRSRHLRQKMSEFSSAVGIPMNCIFPVKNYSEEIDLDDDVDTLILSTLKHMLDFGDDFIDKMKP